MAIENFQYTTNFSYPVSITGSTMHGCNGHGWARRKIFTVTAPRWLESAFSNYVFANTVLFVLFLFK